MDKQKIIRKTEDFANAMSDMRAVMSEKQEPCEPINKLSAFKIKFPDAKRLEPAVRIPTQGIRHPEWEKQKEFLLEYVVGMLESSQLFGSLSFFLGEIPGEDFCQWTVPFNKQVGIPRFVAQHLQKTGSWKEMKPLGRESMLPSFHEDEIMAPFVPTETKRRFSFHPVDSYKSA